MTRQASSRSRAFALLITLLVLSAAAVRAQPTAKPTLVVTGTVRAGEVATGSVIGFGNGALRGVVVDGERQAVDDTGYVSIPVRGTVGDRVSVVLERADGSAEKVRIPVLAAAASGAPVIAAAPSRVLGHERLRIAGSGFEPSAGRNEVTLGATPVPVLAASGGELVIDPSAATAGAQELRVRTPAGVTRRPVEVLHLGTRAPDTTLRRGRRGGTVLVVEGSRERVELEIVNKTPEVIRLAGGDRQRRATSGGGDNAVELRYQAIAPGGFELSVTLAEDDAAARTADAEPSDRSVARVPTAPVPVCTHDCVQQPEDPHVTSWDLIGDLYTNGRLGRTPAVGFDVNHVRHDLRARADHAKATVARLERLFAGFGAADRLGTCKVRDLDEKLARQSFPPFPELTFEIDLCDPEKSDRLADYLKDPDDANARLDAWFQAHASALDHFGLPTVGDHGPGFYAARDISRAMAELERASRELQDTLATSMDLRYNRREAYGRLVNGLVMSVGAVLTAASGGAGGVVLGALAGAAPGLASEALAAAGGQLSPYDAAAAGLGDAVGALGGELDPTNFATAVLEAGGAVLAGGKARDLAAKLEASGARRRDFTRNLTLAMAVLDDAIWARTLELFAEEDGYLEASLRQFSHYREGLRIEVDRQLAELCQQHAKLSALLPAIEQAQNEAERRVHSTGWRAQLQQAFADAGFDCTCCRYEDGSGPKGDCKIVLRTAR